MIRTIKADGTEIGLYVSEERVSQTAKWSPGTGNPPLVITRAIEIALEWAEQEYSRYDSVEINEISLREYGCSTVEGHWVYIFDFRPVIDGNSLLGGANWAAVLMDGSVIGPTEKP
jgi:hypothetical protein